MSSGSKGTWEQGSRRDFGWLLPSQEVNNVTHGEIAWFGARVLVGENGQLAKGTGAVPQGELKRARGLEDQRGDDEGVAHFRS